MGNRFVTPGLSGKATHGTRDLNIRKTGTGRRPSEVELTAEPVDTKSPKSSESYSGAQRGAAKKQEDPKSYGVATNAELEAKGFDESPGAKSREDAEGRSASIVHRSLWDEENDASGRTKVSSETLQGELWNRSEDLFSLSLDSVYETAKTERTNASRCPKDL